MKTQADWRRFYKSLGDDLRALDTLFKQGKNKMARRVFAAYVFTMFEATGRLLVSQVSSAIEEGQTGSVTKRQIDAAKAKESEKVDPVEHIIFAFKYTSMFYGTKDFDHRKVALWEDVETSKEVRNRVIHPKTIEDFNITPQEHRGCKCALFWLLNCLAFLETFQNNPGVSFAEAQAHLSKS